ncbi:hypothetical protein HPP92_009864 [Vanilla planifolia]|uniref:Uncharacterized protein n=1 Tax=Vanilla planifolia TaxID=51239 RepID=A0A835RF26_VANPL|nr:hypothetical protein HPP92_009864 [Vanilla planifolia]
MGASFEDLNANLAMAIIGLSIEIFFGFDAQIDGIATNSIFPSHFFIELILIWKDPSEVLNQLGRDIMELKSIAMVPTD